MKEKNNNDKSDLKRIIFAGALDISMRVMDLSNQGLITYTPNQLLPDDNPDLCQMIGEGIVTALACDLLIQDARYKSRGEQLEAQARTILAQGGDELINIKQINHIVRVECDKVVAENQELIEREIAKRLPEALKFLEDKYKIRYDWMLSSLAMDSIISVSPIAVSPDLVRNIHALENWIVQEDLKLPKKESSGAKPSYDLTELPDYYRDLREIWESAKQDAQKAQNAPLLKANWRKRTQASYSQDLPDDLIEWLNENEQERRAILEARTDLKYLPKKLKDEYLIRKPSEIALEHSARLCGVPPYYYSISRLFEILREKQALWFKTTV